MQVNRNVFGYEIYEAKKFIVETTKTVRGQMLLDTIASYTDNLDFAYDQVYTLYSTRLFVLTSAAVRDSFLHRRLRSASRARRLRCAVGRSQLLAGTLSGGFYPGSNEQHILF